MGPKRVRAGAARFLVATRAMRGTDAGATANHHLDLALESPCAKHVLPLYVRMNFGQAIFRQCFLEQLSTGSATFRRIGTKTQISGVRTITVFGDARASPRQLDRV